MEESFSLNTYQFSDIRNFFSARNGEEKIGQKIQILKTVDLSQFSNALKESFENGARYALLGIPEDIGPRANHGRAGAAGAWDAFLQSFLNRQANEYFHAEQVLCVGHIEVFDLMNHAAVLDAQNTEQCHKLRELCAQIDERVSPVIKELVLAGFEPIVIGGGHNNTFPIQKGVHEALRELLPSTKAGLGCVNCDAHSDFRQMEGRHSGNGFRYAHAEEVLQAYYVLSLHEGYNSQETLDALKSSGFQYRTFESIAVRKEVSFKATLQEAVKYLSSAGFPVGVELDLDSIAFMPSSAETPCGLRSEDAALYIHTMASELPTMYLHLTEGAPALHPYEGVRYVGRSLAEQVSTYIQARENKT